MSKPRIALLGSFPTWPFRDELQLGRDTRTVSTTWNVNLLKGLGGVDDLEVHFFTLAAGIPRDVTLDFHGARLHFLRMSRATKALDLATGCRISEARIGRELAKIGASLVHGIGTEHPFGHIAGRYGLPWVLTVHGLALGVVKNVRGAWMGRMGAFAIMEAGTLRRVRHLISISSYVDRVVKGRAADATQIYSIPNPIDEELFVEPLLQAETRGSDLLFVGTLHRRKGLDTLVEAMVKLRADGLEPTLRVLGGVPSGQKKYMDGVRRLAEELGLRDSIHWAGPVDRATVIHELRHSKVLVLPSREETAPMVICEAFASGTPVVATDVGGVAEMLTDTDAGILVRRDDAQGLATAVALALSDSVQSLPRSSTRRVAEKYHPTEVARQTADVYRALVGGGHR